MDKEIEIGKRIKMCREKAEITQDELGQVLGLNKSTIQRYEAGKIVKIKLPVLQAMANALNVDPNYLALKTDNPIQYPSDKTLTQGSIAVNNKILLSPHELKVIKSYRNKPDMQPVVDKILDIEYKPDKTVRVFKVARSIDGEEAPGYVDMSEEIIQRILDAPEADDF